MSKYLMNKLIHLVNMNEEAEKEYKARPREFVERWEQTQTVKLEPKSAKRWLPKTTANSMLWGRIRLRSGASPKQFGRMKDRVRS